MQPNSHLTRAVGIVMPRTVSSKIRVALPARETWRLRCDFALEQHIASLTKRKLCLVEEEAINEGAEDEQRQRLVRCDLLGDHLNGGMMGVKTGDLGSEILSVFFVNLFDEAHGSDGQHNLKGAAKARFLEERYGAGGFAYIGDSAADLPVWDASAKSVSVDASPALQRQVAAQGGDSEHLQSGTKSGYLAALRPHQWLKNVLVFVPLVAAQSFTGLHILNTILAFVAFSLVSSSGYLLNDLMDLRADRAHPRKCKRPLAAGRVPIAHGTAMMPLLRTFWNASSGVFFTVPRRVAMNT